MNNQEISLNFSDSNVGFPGEETQNYLIDNNSLSPHNSSVNYGSSSINSEVETIDEKPLTATYLSGDNSVLPEQDITEAILSQAVAGATSQLADFVNQPQSLEQMHLAFGDSWQAQEAIAIIQDLVTGEALPNIEVLSMTQLGGNGAFASDTNTIYLAAEFLNENAANPEAITSVVLEETGHFIDSQLNEIDSAGDEGAIFAALVEGKEIGSPELLDLKTEDDSGTLSLSNQTIAVEYSSDEAGVFTVGNLGQVNIEFLADAGSYVGEVAIFSLQGMENLAKGSVDFIKEAASRALSNSAEGYVVISDSTEGSRFTGELGESDKNAGEYLQMKDFIMNPDETFAVMFVPNGTVEEVFNNPGIDDNKRPLFSIAAANPGNFTQMGQLVKESVDGGVFAFEDIRLDQKSDKDYNDVIFKIGGASGFATSLDELVVSDEQWQNTELGQKLKNFAAEELSTATDLGTITGSQTINDFVGTDDPTDVYRFSLDKASNVEITLSGLSADADLVLIEDVNGNGLLDEDIVHLEEIIGISDLEDTATETIDTLLQEGNYFFQVEEFGGDTNYELSLNVTDFVPPTEDTAPNTLSTARDLGLIQDTEVEINNEYVGSADTVDYFKFTLGTLSDVDLELVNFSANADIRLIQDADKNGEVEEEEVIDFADEEGDEDEYIFAPDLEEGEYFIEVKNADGEATYDLFVGVTTSTTPPDNAGNSLNEAKDLGILTGTLPTISDSVNVRDGEDFYKFTLNETSEFSLSLTGSDMDNDADVRLLNDSEELFAESAKEGNDEIERTLAAGTYYIEVVSFQGNTNYNLDLSATATAQPPTPTTSADGTTLKSAINQDSPTFEVSGNLSDTKQSQFYKFTANESGIFTADLTGLTGDADVRLIRDYDGDNSIDKVEDRNGNMYLDKDEVEIVAWLPSSNEVKVIGQSPSPNIYNESIRAFVEKGEYFLEVNLPKKGSTDYNVATKFTPVAEDPLEFKINVEFTEAGKTDLEEKHTDTKLKKEQTLLQTVEAAAEYWSRVITHSTFDDKPHNVTIKVDAELIPEDSEGDITLAYARPIYNGENLQLNPKDAKGRFMPERGESTINTLSTIGYQKDVRYLYETMIHEFGHVLGFLGDTPNEIKKNNNQPSPISWNNRDLVDLSDEQKPKYKAKTFAGIAYGQLLGAKEQTALPLTIGEDPGSDYAHWSRKEFGEEASVESGEAGKPARFSILSVASARDLGYNVNYGAAEPYKLSKKLPVS